MRKITPHKIIRPWGIRYRVYHPATLNGGKRRIEDFEEKAPAQRRCDELNASLVVQKKDFHSLGLPAQAVLVRLYSLCPRGVTDIETKILPRIQQLVNSKSCTFSEIQAELLEEKRKAELSKDYRRVLTWHLTEFSKRFGKRDVSEIRAEEISRWIYSQGWEPKTIQGTLISLKTAFNFAMERLGLDYNPADKVEEPKLSKKPPCILTVEECERLMLSVQSNDPGLLPYFALILFGGLRPEESLRCKREFVHADAIDIPAAMTKNNDRRIVELNRPEMATLKAWLDIGGEMPVRANFKKRFNKVRALAVVGQNGPCQPLKWGHDVLRHSFVSYAVPIHGVAQTSLLADHSESVLNKYYRKRVPKTSAEAFWRILPAL